MSALKRELNDWISETAKLNENVEVTVSTSLLLSVMGCLVKRPIFLWSNLTLAGIVKEIYLREKYQASTYGRFKSRLRRRADQIWYQRNYLEQDDAIKGSSIDRNPGHFFCVPSPAYPLLQTAEKIIGKYEGTKILWVTQQRPNFMSDRCPRYLAMTEFTSQFWLYFGMDLLKNQIHYERGYCNLTIAEIPQKSCEWLVQQNGFKEELAHTQFDCVFFEFSSVFLDKHNVPQHFIDLIKALKENGREVYVATALLPGMKDTEASPYREIEEAANAAPTYREIS